MLAKAQGCSDPSLTSSLTSVESKWTELQRVRSTGPGKEKGAEGQGKAVKKEASKKRQI